MDVAATAWGGVRHRAQSRHNYRREGAGPLCGREFQFCSEGCRRRSPASPSQFVRKDYRGEQGRNPLGLRFLRRFRPGKTVEGDRLANERLECGLVNFLALVDVDRAAYVSVETRVEETGRILQRRALGEGELHDTLVGLAGADDAVVRPDRRARGRGLHPLQLLDGARVCFLDQLAHSAEGFPAPVPEFGDSFRDELRCRLALARARLFHVLILEVPDGCGQQQRLPVSSFAPKLDAGWVETARFLEAQTRAPRAVVWAEIVVRHLRHDGLLPWRSPRQEAISQAKTGPMSDEVESTWPMRSKGECGRQQRSRK